MSNQQNDLSLLRPFNLEAAKNGELLTDVNNFYSFKFLTYCKSDNNIYCQLTDNSQDHVHLYTTNNLRMKPIAWVENKPVYKGDVLWYKKHDSTILFSVKVEGYNPHIHNKSGLIGKVMQVTDKNPCGYKGGETTWGPWDMFTWNKPKQKVKRKIWINVYPDYTYSFQDRKSADYVISSHKRIACVETEIEYEV